MVWGAPSWVWRCAPAVETDEGQGSGQRAGNWPSGSSGENQSVITVPGMLCVKYSPQSHLLEHRAPSLSVKDIRSSGQLSSRLVTYIYAHMHTPLPLGFMILSFQGSVLINVGRDFAAA